jgi:cytochrome P450
MTQTRDAEEDPGELATALSHYDMFEQASRRHKWELLKYARESCPVAHTDAGTGFWMVTRYEDVRRVLEDWQTFSSTDYSPVPNPARVCPLDIDPPLQSAFRQVLNPLFSRSALAVYEDEMRSVARSTIDEWIDNDSVEILSGFAGPYVGTMLTRVVFNDLSPEELTAARDVVLDLAEHPTPELFGQLAAMCAGYLRRAEESGTTEGVLGTVLNAEVSGRPLEEEEKLGVLAVLMLGGLDTTRSAIGSIIYRITQTPGLEDRLRKPNWARRDLDELLRLDPPVGAMARLVTRDCEINGVKIQKGERVLVCFDSANRDERRFRDATSLIFDEPRSGHASFGMGVHRCLGSNMARMQIEIGFDELLKRVKDIRLAAGTDVTWIPGSSNTLQEVGILFEKIGR